MSGHLPGDPYWAEVAEPFLPAARRPPSTLRVGWTVDAPGAVDPEVAAAVESVANALSRLGHRVTRTRPDPGPFRPLIQLLAVTAVGALPIQPPEGPEPLNRPFCESASSPCAAAFS